MTSLSLCAALLASAGGCWYDRPNPWDTSDDVEEYREKTADDWKLAMALPHHPPQHDPEAMADPELEAWRDTVLANASIEVLQRMQEGSVKKVAALEGRIASLLRIDELNRREQLRMLMDLRRIEKFKLSLIDVRLSEIAR